MSNEDQIVNVDGFSSSDEDRDWIGAGAENGLDHGEMESGTGSGSDDGFDDYSDDGFGDGHTAKKGHHNQLEKRRRKTLNTSYSNLKKAVKRINPGTRVGGRDRSVELAFNQIKSNIGVILKGREKAKGLLETLKKLHEDVTNPEDKKALETRIQSLTNLTENGIQLRCPADFGESSSKWDVDRFVNGDEDEEDAEADDQEDAEADDQEDAEAHSVDPEASENSEEDDSDQEHYSDDSSEESAQNGGDEDEVTLCNSP